MLSQVEITCSRPAAGAIGARAVSSPCSVGFILLGNIPARCDWCTFLASRGGGGGCQHEVLAQLKLSNADGGQSVENEQ